MMKINLEFTDYLSIVPEIIVLVTASIVLLCSVFSKRKNLLLWISVIGLFFAFFATKNLENGQFFYEMLKMNVELMIPLKLTLFMGILGVLVAYNSFIEHPKRVGEVLSLILFSVLGMMLMIRANDLLIVFLGVELLSIGFYVLAGAFRKDVLSNEAAVKYLVLGAVSTAFLLMGIALIYGIAGSTNFPQIASFVQGEMSTSPIFWLSGIFLLAGLGFKIALVPFHFWSPDVYQGAPTAITAWMASVPKIAGFIVLFEIFVNVFRSKLPFFGVSQDFLLQAVALLTMIIGNFSALRQTDLKRMLAYSSIAHAGYIFVAIIIGNAANGAMNFYIFVYPLMNFAAFLFLLIWKGNNTEIKQFTGLGRKHAGIGIAMSVVLFSLAGFPPFAGFIAKYGIFVSAIQHEYYLLTIVGILTSFVSVYYYLNVVVTLFMKDESTVEFEIDAKSNAWLFGLLAISLVVLGVVPSLIY